jgi:hypothetical protein
MKWRKLIRVLHRDVGYTAVALTLAYSISGVAVNHMDAWNPNYSFSREPVDVGVLPTAGYDAMEAHVIERLGIGPTEVRGRFMDTDGEFRVFLADDQEITVDIRDGRGTFKRISSRPFLYEVNVLHLNWLKGLWTWVADLFAVSLILLALTGLFMTKGRTGLARRGKWFVTAGLLLPLAFIAYMYLGG